MEKTRIFKDLFENIALRVRNENNLSDIIYAFCNTSNEFGILFLQFFFENYDSNDVIVDFKREFSKNGSRPDFYIKTSRKEYIIEIKINDRSHHFEQYQSEFNNIDFGYIANYYLPKKENIETRTWTEFYDFLIGKLKTKDIKEPYLVEVFISYLKNVCSVIKINKMDLSNIKSLANFNLLIDKVVSTIDNYKTPNFDNKVSNIDFHRYGKYFSLSKTNSEKIIWPWLGVYFSSEKECIYIEINEEWCNEEYGKLNTLDTEGKLKEGTLFIEPYYDAEFRVSYCFEMKESSFEEFNKAGNVEEQERIFKDFLLETINYCEQL